VGFLKEKSAYRATRFETILAWIVTVASAAVVAAFLARAWLAGS
jgi:phosphate/sulfate permease